MIMNTLIQTVDGYKTILGAWMLFVVGLVISFYQGAGWAMPEWLCGLNAAAGYAGASLGVVGLGDKFRKGEVVLPGSVKRDAMKIEGAVRGDE